MRALRGVRISEVAKDKRKENARAELKPQAAQLPKPVVNIGESLFGAKPSFNSSSPANPFSAVNSAPLNPFSISSSATPSNPFAAAGAAQPSETGVKSPQPEPQPQSRTSDLPKTFASALSLNADPPAFGPAPPPEPWPEEVSLPPAYPLYYLDSEYEFLDKVEDLPIPTQTMELDEEASSGGGSQREDKDVYESTIDKTFQKFADRMAQNPEQALRYEYKGQPLLYSKQDAVGKLLATSASSVSSKEHNVKVTTSSSGSGNRMPRCGNCGAGRVFEVQLTPHAIMDLERDEMGIDGMEWGTIIVGVCESDCQQKDVDLGVGYVEEWAGVQWEELAERR